MVHFTALLLALIIVLTFELTAVPALLVGFMIGAAVVFAANATKDLNTKFKEPETV